MNIMYVMFKTLGDVIVSTTIVKELRKEYPGAKIHFFTNKPYGDLLRNNPDIESVIESEAWLLDSVFLEMSSGKYDKIFLPYQVRRECNIWHQEEETRYQHLVDFYWNRMGMHRLITERECYLYPSEQDYAKAADMVSFDLPRIAIHSTTGVATKDWPYFEEFVETMRLLGYGSLQVGAPTDKKIKGAIDFRGKMSFLELAAFLSKCSAFVGLDSGVSYIADAMKTPTIVIQGSTNPTTSGPISSRVVHLFAKETGYPDCQVVRCHQNCRHEVNCITHIKVKDVIDALDKIADENKWVTPLPVMV
mgnify:CR=1 FL=1